MLEISIMNGDVRNARLAGLLREDGFAAKLFERDEIEEATAYGRVIVLPIKGMSSDSFNGYLSEGQHLVSGEDFLQREDFAILNAIPTAEGALEIAMGAMQSTIHGSHALVIGFGRIGKLLCRSLANLGAKVSASARRDEDFAWMTALGYNALHTLRLDGELGGFDVVFNTVPHLVLPHARLRELKKDAVIIDLASAPGGVDFKSADRLGLTCRWALSLPGKCAPESAAKYMRDTLYNILKERGVLL